MKEFPPVAFVRKLRMKRAARVFFVLSIMTVLVPVVVGLFGHNTGMPIGLIVVFLMTDIVI